MSDTTKLEGEVNHSIKAALDDLVARGVITLHVDLEGVERYGFPDKETGLRLLMESRRGGK